MDFYSIACKRQSCRNFDAQRQVEQEKIDSILKAASLAPSACNSQPYHLTVCYGQKAKEVEKATTDMGMNKFALDAPVAIVISEEDYVKSAALGAKIKNNDYRSIDIGIVAAYLTSQATAEGLSSCILGWFNNEKIQKTCCLKNKVRLVIVVGYANKDDELRVKKRKKIDEIVSCI